MRHRLCLLPLLLLPLLLAGCQREEPARTAYQLYFQEADLTCSAGDSPFRTETVYLYDSETDTSRRLAEALLNELLKGPADETLKSTLPAGTSLLSLELAGDRALVDLSASYESLSGVALTLADGAIAMTLAQIPEISSVQITARGRELAYRERQVLNIREVLLTPEEDVISTVEARLYFLNQEGSLIPETRTLDLYEGDTQVSAVARALEEKPEGRDLYSPLPEGFQVKSVWLEEDICYVNLSSALLEGLGESALQTALRALEDSLSSLEAVEDAREACRKLGMDHYTFNFSGQFVHASLNRDESYTELMYGGKRQGLRDVELWPNGFAWLLRDSEE